MPSIKFSTWKSNYLKFIPPTGACFAVNNFRHPWVQWLSFWPSLLHSQCYSC